MRTFTSISLLLVLAVRACVADAATTPIDFTLNLMDNGQPTPVEFRAWIPQGVSQIRGLIFNLPGAGQDSRNITTNGSFQSILPGIGFGIIGLKDTLANSDVTYWGATPQEGEANFQAVLDAVSQAFNHPEIANAPAIFDGISKGGYAASYLASLVPERTIGYIGDKGFGLTVNSNDFSALTQVPGLMIVGSKDQTVPPIALNPFYQEARAQGAPLAQAIDWNVGHSATNPQIRLAFMDQIIRARYPAGQVPSSTPGDPLQLTTNTPPWLGQANTLDTSQGYSAATTFTPIPWPQIGPVDGNSNPNLDATVDSVLPTQAMAMVYQAENAGTYNATTRPLQISVLNSVNTSVNNGQPIDIGITLTGLTSNHIALYHDEDLIAVFNESAGQQQFLYTPTENGLQTFIAIAEYNTNGVSSYTSNFAVVGVSNLPEPGAGVVFLAGIIALRPQRRPKAG